MPRKSQSSNLKLNQHGNIPAVQQSMTQQQNPSVLSKLLAGGGASILSKTCVAPFERTKLLLQTQTVAARGTQTPWRILATIVQTQGTKALWRGNSANCVRVFPTYALRFAFFDMYQHLASQGAPPDAPLAMWRQLVAGGLSGATTLSLTYPLDVVRTRLATNSSGVRPGLVATVLKTYRGEGLHGFYKGYIISVIEISPYLAVSMGGYNYLKERFETTKPHSHWYNLLFGWLSGTTASLVCYPMDTIKRRMMLAGSADHALQQHSIRDVLKNLGVRGLYAGCLVNALTSGPAAAITFAANDKLRELLL